MSANALNSIARAPQPESATNAVHHAKEMKRVREASEGFESLFVTQMYQAMRRTAPPVELFGNTRDEELFRDLLDQEVAKTAAQSRSFGLGETLYQQMAPKPTIVRSGKTDLGPEDRQKIGETDENRR
jgi:Rod binding domain-containing protein